MVQIKQEFQRQFGTTLDAMIEVRDISSLVYVKLFIITVGPIVQRLSQQSAAKPLHFRLHISATDCHLMSLRHVQC